MIYLCMCSTIFLLSIFFFFSSRRRHTRFDCDWSSDVCSSDLDFVGILFPPIGGEAAGAGGGEDGLAKAFEQDGDLRQPLLAGAHSAQQHLQLRHDPPLLAQRSEREFEFFYEARRNASLSCRAGKVFLGSPTNR